MQRNVFALVIVNLYRNFGLSLAFRHLDISLDDVIILARRHSLCEFTATVRNQLPFGLLVGGTADRDRHPGCGAIIGAPDSAIDQRIVFGWSRGLLCWLRVGRTRPSYQ